MKRGKGWLQRHKQDPFVKQARRENYRSRAVFKLQQIDQRDRIFMSGQFVVDLGAAPGGWSQYAAERIQPGGRLLAVDILPMDPLDNVEFIQGDFSGEETFDECMEISGDHKVDLVISDLAPNLTGIRDTDQARSMYLAELVLDFARRALAPGGSLLIKLFQGAGVDAYRKELNVSFQKLIVRKPDASRDDSREFYILARGYKI